MTRRAQVVASIIAASAGISAPSSGLHVTLDDVTLAATAEVVVDGALAITLDDATLAATGEVVVDGELAITMDDATVAATADVLTIVTFPESIVYPIDPWHLNRNMTGASIDRAWASVVQGGDRYTVSMRSDGYGANAVTWCASLAGSAHAFADLAAGAHDADVVAQAWADEMEGLGVTGITVRSPFTLDGVQYCQVAIADASGRLVSASISTDETARGMRGCRRAGTDTPFGTAVGTDASLTASMGAAVSVHIARRDSNARRITGVYALDVRGSGDFRLAISSGPAYSTTPSAFTMTEGLSEANGVVRLMRLREPMAEPSSPWVTFLGPGGGGANLIAFRLQSANPPGIGDYTATEAILSNGGVTDPSARISSGGSGDATYATGGSYTHGGEIGPFTVYSVVGYLYEDADVNGDYGDQAGFDTWIGYHGTYNQGSPTTGTPAVIGVITETFRHPIQHACNLVAFRAAYADNAADEDSGLWIYDWTGATIAQSPVAATVEQLAAIGPCGFSAGAGYKTHTLATPIPLAANSIVGALLNHGNDDRTTPADTIATLYDAGTDNGYLSGGADTWCDMITIMGGGYQADAQYVTVAGGDMIEGDIAANQPDPFDPNATDTRPTNKWRNAIRVVRAGLS